MQPRSVPTASTTCQATSSRTDGFDDVSSDVQSGASVGIVFGWYLGKTPIIIEPGLYYSFKGGKLDGNDRDYEMMRTRLKTNMHMFEIPLVFKYEVQYHNAGVCLHPFFGGFLAFGIGGKTKSVEGGYTDSWYTFSDGTWPATSTTTSASTITTAPSEATPSVSA